jgi:enamine deaminase RidA (YjgF/YER057c/UK114 family)
VPKHAPAGGAGRRHRDPSREARVSDKERRPPVAVPGATAPGGGYVDAYEVLGPARVLHISGQIPVGPDGAAPAAFGEQCRQVWANLTAVLARHGMGLGDLVKVTTFLSDRRYREENSAIRREILGEHRPALTILIAGIYDPAWLLEIEAIAAAGERAG